MTEIVFGPHRLILGDCLDVIPKIGPVDAFVTDPPYEKMKGGTSISWSGGVAERSITTTVGTELGNSEGLKLFSQMSKAAICFCSFQWVSECKEMLGGKPVALLSWFKRNTPASVNNAPWFQNEFVWAIQYQPGIEWRTLKTNLDFPMLQAGCFATERLVDDSGKSLHPTQKPLKLMSALILPGMETVCDPYMGTGTTGLACIRHDRKFVGIEKALTYLKHYEVQK